MTLAARSLANTPDVKAAVDACAAAMRTLREPLQIQGHDKAAAELILACERLQTAAETVAKDARAALVGHMQATGVVAFDIGHQRISIVAGRRHVIVSGPVPDEYMTTPEPQPDKAALAKALNAGEQIANARLSNGGPSSLRFAGKKQ